MPVQHVPGREAALRQLAKFLPNAGSVYTSTRNFDYGPDDRNNVSILSPYLRHRLLLEREVLEAVLAEHTFDAAEKFIQELFWRAYFKGWLERRPQIWNAYRQGLTTQLDKLEHDADLRVAFDRAVRGNTGIDCFDAWTKELLETGYLHNHARMWFASIWVFTLELPWELGADFFYRHLMDGDPASNTLSWRWVCGLHTRGKTYLARVSNITSYTNNRFNPGRRLATSAPPLHERLDVAPRVLPEAGQAPSSHAYGLLITEEDCMPETLGLNYAPQAVLGVTMTGRRSPLPIALPARAFALGAVADAIERVGQRFDVVAEQAEAGDLGAELVAWAHTHGFDCIVTAYPATGPVADSIAGAKPALDEAGIRLVKLRRAYDELTWRHTDRGYFRLQSRIPDILSALGLSATPEPLKDSALAG